MGVALDKVLQCLDLKDVARDEWEGNNPDRDAGHLFGGQVLAQGLVAAQRSLGGDRAHSLHAYFLRRGTPETPIRFAVQCLRTSRSFRTATVTASQRDEAILQMTVSFHSDEPGPSHQISMDETSGPEGESLEDAVGRATAGLGGKDDSVARAMRRHDGPDRATRELPVEIRGVGGIGMFSDEMKPPHARCWMRTRGRLPDDPLLHQCMFVYASDLAMMMPVMQPHPFGVNALQTASLDHALWFHADFRMDDWLLFELDSPVTRGGRGIGRGLLYTRAGDLVGSCVQECLLRPVRPAS